jgi:hypothetical protein
MYFAQMIEMRLVEARVSTGTGIAGEFGSGLEDLVLSNVVEHKEGGHDWIVGTITNNGQKTVRGVQVEADLFKSDTFVDQYSTHLSGSIKPRESRNFKIACGCRDDAPADHDAFKLKVTSAY